MTACTHGARRNAASVVDYLYSGQREPHVDSTTTVLKLPLRVGIAFVPSLRGSDEIVEADRTALLDQVAARFRGQPFVQSIEIIPSAYLQQRGGFSNVDQIQRMFDIDVITLVSYDQVQFTDSQRASITYWTIVGAYLVEGDRNDTRTLLDAAVFDIASRKLLFRAPGVSTVKGSSTPVNLSEELRRDSRKGFQLAQQDLTPNLEKAMEAFRARVRTNALAGVQVDTKSRPGGSSAGAIDLFALALGIVIVAGGLFARRRSA